MDEVQRLQAANEIATSCKIELNPSVHWLNSERVRNMITRHFIDLQKDSVAFIEAKRFQSSDERHEAMAELGQEMEDYKGTREDLPPLGVAESLDAHLKSLR